MPRVVGIDPGTLSLDLCGIEDGRLFLDTSLPTRDALATPSLITDALAAAAPLDLVAGPSGYGVPLVLARNLTEADIRLACLAPEGETGGIGGVGRLLRTLALLPMPVMLTPGVVHLASVPEHRKVNRVDMGTADKVCAVVLAMRERMQALRCGPEDVSLILLELGGAFTAVVAVEHGRIVDGVGGTAGPMGARASGALDGEVAFLAGMVSKSMLFTGGAASIAGAADASAEEWEARTTQRARLGRDAYLESTVKAVAALAVSAPLARHVVLSGRIAHVTAVREELAQRITAAMPGASVGVLEGFAKVAKQAAQGAALLADGLAGGSTAALVDRLGIREASGTVLDHLYVISPDSARSRLGIV